MTERIVYGLNAVSQLLRRSPDRIQTVYLQENLGDKRLRRLRPDLEVARSRVRRVAPDALAALTGTTKHQGVAALVSDAGPLTDSEALDLIRELAEPLLLVLDAVQDPRNFGACLRTANAAGVDLVIAGRSRNVGLTPVVSKVAAGAAEVQPIAQVSNLARFLAALPDLGVVIVGTDEAATRSFYEVDLTGPIALVLGSEGRGLRRLTREHCDVLARLPMRGSVESLNVAVAAGVCIYECLRQRQLAQPPGVG